MSSKESVFEFEPVVADDIKELVKLEMYDGKEFLADLLGISPYIDDDDPQKELFISYLYDTVIFTVEKGFPWGHVAIAADFSNRLLRRLLIQGHKLTHAVKDFKALAPLLDPLSDRHQKQLTDFIFETVLHHYHLYKYVFTRLRDEVKPEVNIHVITPPEPPPLSTALEVDIWEYNEKVKAVEREELEAKARQVEDKRRLDEAPTGHKDLGYVSQAPQPFNQMTLKELVNDVLAGYTEMRERNLSMKVDEVSTDLNYKFEKTAIARPAALGPPPRFKPKTPESGKSSKTNLKADTTKDSKRNSTTRVKSARGSAIAK